MHRKYVLITGGAGFVGTNVARSYLAGGQPVHIIDNLSRPGVSANISDLQRQYPRDLLFTQTDVRNRADVERAVETADVVYHLAAQVAVTTSLDDPLSDLETNLMGTMRVLEAIRRSSRPIPVLFTSTNKVYGKLAGVVLQRRGSRWEPEDARLACKGVGEDQPLEFLSPYGCSKGGADQYVLDYAHSFGIAATVFRMSCIYGPYQLGSEDQGWVAHFLRQAMKRLPVTIFGDGKQVRDLLFIDDLVSAMRCALDNISLASGEAFNIGGGPRNSTSLVGLLDEISRLLDRKVEIQWAPERMADQKWYVADTKKIENRLRWQPGTSIASGLSALRDWYLQRPSLVTPSLTESEVQVA